MRVVRTEFMGPIAIPFCLLYNAIEHNLRTKIILRRSENDFWHLVDHGTTSRSEWDESVKFLFRVDRRVPVWGRPFSIYFKPKVSTERGVRLTVHTEDSLSLSLYTPDFVKLSNQMQVVVRLGCINLVK